MLAKINGFEMTLSILGDFPKAVWESVIMVIVPGIFAVIIGLILASVLVATRNGGVSENKAVYRTISLVIDLLRSTPALILMVLLIVVTREIAGVAFGIQGALFPLIVASFPVFTRQIENALLSVDPGVIEASSSMGLKPRQIIISVYIKEAIPAIINGVSISLIALLGESTIAGMIIGAGGLGDMAVRYGYHRQATDVAIVCVILSLVLVLVIQALSSLAIKRYSHNR